MNAVASLSIGFFFSISGLAVGAPEHVHTHASDGSTQQVHGCWGDEHGDLEGGVFSLPADPDAMKAIDELKASNRRGGVVDNRLDLVIVGDGYTAGEMGQFHSDADGIENSFFSYEPFISYKPYFRVTQVEVISNESGVDNDPSQGISRDTALDMAYWCGGTERLLCVSTSKANAAAAAGAPDVDQVIAISNSSKYGGAGYSFANLGTAAGHNFSAAQIAIHEIGHSLGNLADEYTYGGSETYTGGEISRNNVSIYNESEQISRDTKWSKWMGTSISGFDNPIGTYEGGQYHRFGVYRPSSNSMMRNLGRRFNLVGAEQLLFAIYQEVRPIEDGTADGAIVSQTDSLWVEPMQPANHDLQVLWFLDDVELTGAADQSTLDLNAISFGSGEHTIRVEVSDQTPWVRNEALRAALMTQSRSFQIEPCNAIADFTGDGIIDFFDVAAFLDAYASQSARADLTRDGIFDFFDVADFLDAFGSGECK